MGFGMNPKFFGNNAWTVYHNLNLSYDKLHRAGRADVDIRNAIKVFDTSFPRILQCKFCRDHSTGFDLLIEKTEWNLSSAIETGDCFTRSVRLHNMVNRKLGRKEWSVEEARAHWMRETDGRGRHADLWYYMVLLALHYDDNDDPNKATRYRQLFDVFPCLMVLMLPAANVAMNTAMVHSCAKANSNEHPLIGLSTATFFRTLHPLGLDLQTTLHIDGCNVIDIIRNISKSFMAEKNKYSLLGHLERIHVLLSSAAPF